MKNSNQTYHRISLKANEEYPVLRGFAGCLLTEDQRNEADKAQELYPTKITTLSMIDLAHTFQSHYDELLEKAGDDEALLEHLESTIGVSQSEVITTLCYLLGLTEPIN